MPWPKLKSWSEKKITSKHSYLLNKIESQSQTASNLQFVKTMFVMIMFV